MLNASLLFKNVNLNQTLISLIDKCKSMAELKQIHALVIALGLVKDEPFATRILSVSATSAYGDMDYSYRIFLQLSNPTIFNWNTIIRGYSKGKNPSQSIFVFVDILRVGVSPDHLTFPFLAKASTRLSALRLGVAVHGRISKTGMFDEMPKRNLVSWDAMLDGYAKCGDIDLAREVFELMPERDVVWWSSLIDGYVKDDDHGEALAIFERMQVVGPKANEVTMVSVLCACAHLDMYAKCGAIRQALTMFHGVLINQTDVLIWNAMIGGLAMHGFVMESLNMFREMQIVGITPDEITYLCLLSACAHGGLVKEAWFFFVSLGKASMTPKSEHYACMVDVLARAGQLTEAYQFLCQMPMEPTASMLGALLSGCMNHRKLDLAEIVGKKLIELEPYHDDRYIGLSNVYAVVKRWDEARTMREAMERRGEE
ncbi:hypothetical protein F0562_023951 [Nyssa sinensis]|uniref:Pentatricopeptide repeat-containing protein n=1 Tax=Nyssa sinensis TaxID=561372 RepID=A0A5J5BJ43_9ASTE|nr:hypothetical protein F0562_023951 [Nyssa sinensis]